MHKLLLFALLLSLIACKSETKEDPAPKPIDNKTIILNHNWNTLSHKNYYDGVGEDDPWFECNKDDIYTFNPNGTYLMSREGFGVHCHPHEQNITGTWHINGPQLIMTEKGGAPVWDYTIESITDTLLTVRRDRVGSYVRRVFKAIN